jgi:mannose-6-phosphate isomerase-like protein (cupin superfamily)
MATLFHRAGGKRLDLPGRTSHELVSAAQGSAGVSLRLVEIEPERPEQAPRGPHVHVAFEEVIHVLSGRGVTETAGERYPIESGDTLLIAANEKHVTRNTGTEPLRLLCFFPVGDVMSGTEELRTWDSPRSAP